MKNEIFPNAVVEFVRDLYRTNQNIPLHAPIFCGNEAQYVSDTIKSTFVSSVGEFVNKFEQSLLTFTLAKNVVATVNGTAALHASLYAAGVKQNDIVITQALTFVATGNVIHHMGASPVFLDISRESLSLCPLAVKRFLEDFCDISDGSVVYTASGQKVTAVVPMHTFGHPAHLDELSQICADWGLSLIEDAAESLGSTYKGVHTGCVGDFGALSFNGNKVITTGGGGAVLTRNKALGDFVRHVTTTAKTPHPYEFIHDRPAFNYRLPNLNAALGYAQMEKLGAILSSKRKVAEAYQQFFKNSQYDFVEEPSYARSNFWLNAVICPDKHARDYLLNYTNEAGVMTRPVWRLLTSLPMFEGAIRDDLTVAKELESKLVNLPSSAIGI